MKLTRRGLLGWLGALTGAAAVAKVAPAAAEAPKALRVGATELTFDKPRMGAFWSAPLPEATHTVVITGITSSEPATAQPNPYALHSDYQALMERLRDDRLSAALRHADNASKAQSEWSAMYREQQRVYGGADGKLFGGHPYGLWRDVPRSQAGRLEIATRLLNAGCIDGVVRDTDEDEDT